MYGGEFQFGQNEYKPIDLKNIGKYKCHLFTGFLENFHRDHTDQGRNRWNRARVEKRIDGENIAHFIWDQGWEKNEIKAYVQSGSERGKWYWEEK